MQLIYFQIKWLWKQAHFDYWLINQLTWEDKIDSSIDDNEVCVRYEDEKRNEDQENWEKAKEKRQEYYESLESYKAMKKRDEARLRIAKWKGSDLDTDMIKWDKFDTVVIQTRWVPAVKAIHKALAKWFKVVQLYTPIDEWADYLDPTQYEDEYPWMFKAIPVPSHTIKRWSQDVVKDSDSYVINYNDSLKNPYIQRTIDVLDEVLWNANWVWWFPWYWYDSENSNFVSLLDIYNSQRAQKWLSGQVSWLWPNAKAMEAVWDKVKALKLTDELDIYHIPSSEAFCLSEKEEAINAFIETMERYKSMWFTGQARMKCSNWWWWKWQATLSYPPKRDEISSAWEKVASEATAAWWDVFIYIEPFIENARHLEVQIMWDWKWWIEIYWVRDCSAQRWGQKTSERTITREKLPEWIYDSIIKSARLLWNHVNYLWAWTVEFMMFDKWWKPTVSFMEMNTRVQVEHWVTEREAWIDILSELMEVSQGYWPAIKEENIRYFRDSDAWEALRDTFVCQARINAHEIWFWDDGKAKQIDWSKDSVIERLNLPTWHWIHVEWWVWHWNRQTSMSDSNMWILIVEWYDKLDWLKKMVAALDRLVVDGVKNNIWYQRKYYKRELALLEAWEERNETINWVSKDLDKYATSDEEFLWEQSQIDWLLWLIWYAGVNWWSAIWSEFRNPYHSRTKSLIKRLHSLDPKIQKIFDYDFINELHYKLQYSKDFIKAENYKPRYNRSEIAQILNENYIDKKWKMMPWWLKMVFDLYWPEVLMWEVVPYIQQVLKKPLFTVTDIRDAHQSEFATRLRLVDSAQIAMDLWNYNFFSVESWWWATFDVDLQFLKEDPQRNMEILSRLMPNNLMQILQRWTNGQWYSAIQKKLIDLYLQQYAQSWTQVFRIFDSSNDINSLVYAIEQTRKLWRIAEWCVCYMWWLDDPKQKEYKQEYYENMAIALVKAWSHAICIKDMAWLATPAQAAQLFSWLRKKLDNAWFSHVALHYHTHDTLNTAVSNVVNAIEAWANIVDVTSAFSGWLGQANFQNVILQLAAIRKPESPQEKWVQTTLKWIVLRIQDAEAEISKIRNFYFNKITDWCTQEELAQYEREKEEAIIKLRLLNVTINKEREKLIHYKSFLLQDDPYFQNYADVFETINTYSKEIQSWYKPWASNVDFEAMVIESYIPWWMVSNYRDQLKNNHLEWLDKEAFIMYAKVRQWWWNPPLVTPSSKYVWDQVVWCLQNLKSQYWWWDEWEKKIKELVASWKMDIDTFFWWWEFIIPTTTDYFAWSLWQHPNWEWLNADWREMIDKDLDDKKIDRYLKPVEYYQSLTREHVKRLTWNLKFLLNLKWESEAIASWKKEVHILLEFLRDRYENKWYWSKEDIKGLDDLIDLIAMPSEQEVDEAKAMKEYFSEWILDYHGFELDCNNGLYLLAFDKLWHNEIESFWEFIKAKNIEREKKWNQKIRRSTISKFMESPLKAIVSDENSYNNILKREEKDFSWEDLLDAINHVARETQNEEIIWIGIDIKWEVRQATRRKNILLDYAFRDFLNNASLAWWYWKYSDWIDQYWNLARQLPTEVFFNGLSEWAANDEWDSVEVKADWKIYKITMMQISKSYQNNLWSRRVTFKVECNWKSEIVHKLITDKFLEEKFKKRTFKAEKTPYWPNKQFVDVYYKSSWRRKAPVKINKVFAWPWVAVKKWDIIMELDVNKVTHQIIASHDWYIASYPAEEWEYIEAWERLCVINTEKVSESDMTCFHNPNGVEKWAWPWLIKAPAWAKYVTIYPPTRLSNYSKWIDVIALIEMQDWSTKEIKADFNCMVDIIYGKWWADKQRINEWQVIMYLKDAAVDTWTKAEEVWAEIKRFAIAA